MNTGADTGFFAEMPKRFFGRYDRIFGILFFVLGYLFARCWFFTASFRGFGLTAVMLAILFSVCGYCILAKKRFEKVHIALTAFLVAVCFAYSISRNDYVENISLISFTVGLTYLLMILCKNESSAPFDGYFLFDGAKAIFQIPFSAFGSIWGAVFSSNRENKGKNRYLSKVAAGLAVGTVPLIMVISLLKDADAAFSNIFDSIFVIDQWSVFENFLMLMFGVPLALYLFGALWGNCNQYKKPDSITESHNDFLKKAQKISPATVLGATVPLLLVYGLFFVSQFAYFVSAFENILPPDYSYAEYARKGFFELCSVAVINLCIIGCINLFCQRKEGKKPLMLKIITILISVCTEVLVAIDIAKMAMYINSYGLTSKRFVTTWFMILLGLVFLLIIIKQVFEKLRFNLCTAGAVAMMVLVLIFSNVDARIAQYNVNSYLDGNLETVDIKAMYTLDDGAVPYVASLLDCDDTELRDEAEEFLRRRAEKIRSKTGFSGYSFNTVRANRILKEKGIWGE